MVGRNLQTLLSSSRLPELCVRWLTGGEEEELVRVSSGVGTVHLGKLPSCFPLLFSCCLLLALVSPQSPENHVHRNREGLQRKVDHVTFVLCEGGVLWLSGPCRG